METIPSNILKELHQAERKHPHSIVALLDASGYLKYVSPTIKEFTGRMPHETVGHHFLDFYDEPDSARMAIAMQECLRNGRTGMLARSVKVKEGGKRRMEGDAWKVLDEDTGMAYVLAVSGPAA